jgi:hypothetical protein
MAMEAALVAAITDVELLGVKRAAKERRKRNFFEQRERGAHGRQSATLAALRHPARAWRWTNRREMM